MITFKYQFKFKSVQFISVSVNLLVQQPKCEFKSQHKYTTTEYKT